MPSIDFPGFDEFLQSLPSDYFEKLDIPTWDKPIQTLLPTTEKGAYEYSSVMLGISLRAMLQVLRDYHEWLIEQLAQRSLRLPRG